jgi:hypothetical protein
MFAWCDQLSPIDSFYMSQFPYIRSFLRKKSSYSWHHCLHETHTDSCISMHVFKSLFSHQPQVWLPQVSSPGSVAQIKLHFRFSEWRMVWQRYYWISLSNPAFAEKNYSYPDMEGSNRSDTCCSDSEMRTSMKCSERYCFHSKTWSRGQSWFVALAAWTPWSDSHFQQGPFVGQPSSDARLLSS